MCGICGIIGGDPAAREPIVRTMMNALAHRGPDDEGLHASDAFTFGHRRLSIIDLERGGQPMISPDGRYVIIYNGEIYNYVELRQKLVQQGVAFSTFSDTEVLLQLLIREGKAALRQLNGMFAFAFGDQETGEWMLARDPFGIKPLYYAVVSGSVVFASEIKAILAHPGIEPRANSNGIQHYLTFQFCLRDETLFEGVRKIEPGHFLQGRAGEPRDPEQYWDTNYHLDEYHNEDYFTERLRGLLEDSVRLQLRSDVPLGAYLSGGLDSSVVALLAARHLHHPIHLFHGTFRDGPEYDESEHARSVAEEAGGKMRTVTPTAEQFVQDMPRLIRAMDEPVAGPALFPQYHVSKLAKEHVKVVLGGQGGDEIFGGYARYLVAYLEQALKGAVFETQEEGKHLVTLSSIIPNLPLLKQYRPLLQHFWRDGLFGEMDARYFRLIDRTPDAKRLLTPEAFERLDREAIFEEFRGVFNHPDTKSYVNKMTHFDQKTLLPALLQVEDRVSMAVSLESRVPLLDTRIVDLVTSMPPPLKFQGGRTKHVLKKAMKNVVPEPVLHRKDKMGFPVPLKEWMEKGPVRDFVEGVLLSQACRERGLYDPAALSRLIREETAFGRQLWGALCLELWYQQFIDRP